MGEKMQLDLGLKGPVLVVGLGASGRAALELCHYAGLDLHAYDRKALDGPGLVGVQYFSGAQIPDLAFEGVQSVVMSPGVDPRPVKAQMQRLGIQAPLLGEMGLALASAQRHWPAVKTVLVTGTNGKSTVTDLCAHLLRAQFAEVFAGGNLGIPLSAKVLEIAKGQSPIPDAWVLECSSYQLETLRGVRAQVAMLLNVTPDHLDRYRDIEDYAQTKAKIFDALGAEDLALLDAQDPRTPNLRPPQARVVEIGGQAGPGWRASEDQEGVLWLGPDQALPRSLVPLAGQHNAKNAVFALLAARHLGISLEDLGPALANYEGLAHRMERVQSIGDVVYFNDSKATNIASVRAGLSGFPYDYLLICGGQLKQGDEPEELLEILSQRCRALIGFGASGQRFVEVAKQSGIEAWVVETLSEAVSLASKQALAGQAVVLSPGGASFDQFRSFVHRGDVFVESVRALDA